MLARTFLVLMQLTIASHTSFAAAQSTLPEPRPGEVEDGFAFVTFVNNVAARRTALMCERGLPGYREQFDALMAKWSEKHGVRVARGEAIYRDIVANRRPWYGDRARLDRLQKAVEEIEGKQRSSEPLQLTFQQEVECDETLSELRTGIAQPLFGRPSK